MHPAVACPQCSPTSLNHSSLVQEYAWTMSVLLRLLCFKDTFARVSPISVSGLGEIQDGR